MPSSLTLAEVLQVLAGPLEEVSAWALLHNAAKSMQDAHNAALVRSAEPSLQGIGPLFIIHPETLFLQRRGRVQFLSGIQASVDLQYTAPEVHHDGEQISGGRQLAQAQVFSLSVLVMSALDHEEKREISDLLHTLLSQMNSRQADNRPTLSTIISHASEQLNALSPSTSADDELDKLFSLVYGDQDQLETSYADSDSVADDATLAAELAAVEVRRRNSLTSADRHSSVNGSEDCMSLTSKGSVGIHGSMDSLNRQGSTRSASSATGVIRYQPHWIREVTRRGHKMPTKSRWSSYERLKLLQKDIDILTSRNSGPVESNRSLFYTPVRPRRAGATYAGMVLPPSPSLTKTAPNSITKQCITKNGDADHISPSTNVPLELSTPSTEAQKLDQLLVEIDSSPLHCDSSPDMTTLTVVEPFLPHAHSTPNIVAAVTNSNEHTLRLPTLPSPSPSPSPLSSAVHPDMSNVNQATPAWLQDKEEEEDTFKPSLPSSPPPDVVTNDTTQTVGSTTFDYSSSAVTKPSIQSPSGDEFVFTTAQPTLDTSVSSNQDDGSSQPVTQTPVEIMTCDQRVSTVSVAIDEAFKQLDKETNAQTHPAEVMLSSPHAPIDEDLDCNLPNHPSKQEERDEEELTAAFSKLRTSTPVKSGVTQSPQLANNAVHVLDDDDPPLVFGKPVDGDTPVREDEDCTIVSKVKKEEVIHSDVVLTHMGPPSLHSTSVEDVIDDREVLIKPCQAAVSHNELSSTTPSSDKSALSLSSSLSSESLQGLPTSNHSISKLQTVFGDEFLQLSGGPTKTATQNKLSLDVPKGKHVVHVHLLNDTVLTLYVDPMCLCGDFFHHVACLVDIKEWMSFGLSVFQDNSKQSSNPASSTTDEVFLEPDRRIYKYAPSQWMKSPPPDPADRNPQHWPRPFTVHFRVMFYIRWLSRLELQQTRHLYYLQLCRDIRRGTLECSWDQTLELISLALQYKYGDQDVMNTSAQYFKARHYLPMKDIMERGEQAVTDKLTELHGEHVGLSCDQAEDKFLQRAMSLENYGKIAYDVTRNKAAAHMVYTVSGISVLDITQGHKTAVLDCAWKNISNIAFDHCKITLTTEGEESVIVYASSFRRAAYLLRFAKLCHKFHISTRDPQPPHLRPLSLSNQVIAVTSTPAKPAQPVKSAKPVEEPIAICSEYEGEKMTVKMLKKAGQGIGLRIKDHTSPTGVTYTEVEELVKGGTAIRYLKPGDLILALNGKTLNGLSHQTVGDMFNVSPPLVQVTVLRRVPNKHAQQQNTAGDGKLALPHHTHRRPPPPPPCRNIKSSPVKNSNPVPASQHTQHPSSSSKEEEEETCYTDGNKNDSLVHTQLPSAQEPTGWSEQAIISQDSAMTEYSGHQHSVEEVDSNVAVEYRTMSSRPSHITSTTTLENESQEETAPGPVPMYSGETRTLQVCRKHGSFGFAIKGSSKNKHRPVRVTTVTEGGAADKSGLAIGDHIIAINGEAIEGRGYSYALCLLQTVGDSVTLLVAKGQPGNDKLSIALDKDNGALGFRYTKQQYHTVVTVVTPNSQAAKAGIKQGDILLEVNGHSLLGLSQREVYALIAAEQSSVHLLVERSEKASLKSIPEQSDTAHGGNDELDTARSHSTIVRVALTKVNNQLGFRIKKHRTHRANSGLIITNVDRDPALSDGRVNIGDELLEVNGNSLIGLSHENALQLLKAEPAECLFTIRRQLPLQQVTTIPEISVTDSDGDMCDVRSLTPHKPTPEVPTGD